MNQKTTRIGQSLRFNVISRVFALIVILLTFLGLYQYILIGNQAEKQLASDRQLATNYFSSVLVQAMWEFDKPLINELVAAQSNIRIPILKGLLGSRLLVIREQEQPLFSKINTLDELSKFQAGQGTFWEDTDILRHNGITTITTNKFQNLFPMLAGKRFDFFPRAIHEPWVELDEFSNYRLSVENHLLLVYPYALYFFVSPENKALAEQIEQGMNQAIDDGSYDRLFFNSRIVGDALKKAKLSERTIIRLKNSNASPETPIDIAKYWINIKELPKMTE